MIQIDHRDSHDIDIFLPNRQLLPYIDPETHDFTFEIPLTGYEGDGWRSRKFSFGELGEIDFIAAPDLTSHDATPKKVEGAIISVEAVPEIIAKKVYYRGANITPRDIFDIAAAARLYGDQIRAALAWYPEQVGHTLKAIETRNPEFVKETVSRLMVRLEFQDLQENALQEARKLLCSISYW